MLDDDEIAVALGAARPHAVIASTWRVELCFACIRCRGLAPEHATRALFFQLSGHQQAEATRSSCDDDDTSGIGECTAFSQSHFGESSIPSPMHETFHALSFFAYNVPKLTIPADTPFDRRFGLNQQQPANQTLNGTELKRHQRTHVCTTHGPQTTESFEQQRSKKMSTIATITEPAPTPSPTEPQPAKVSQLEQLLRQGKVFLQDLRAKLAAVTNERDQLVESLKERDASHEKLWAEQAELQRTDNERHGRELEELRTQLKAFEGIRSELDEAVVTRTASRRARNATHRKLVEKARPTPGRCRNSFERTPNAPRRSREKSSRYIKNDIH